MQKKWHKSHRSGSGFKKVNGSGYVPTIRGMQHYSLLIVHFKSTFSMLPCRKSSTKVHRDQGPVSKKCKSIRLCSNCLDTVRRSLFILRVDIFSAPEILQLEPITLAADIWSLGVLAYVLLTGFSPFGGDTDQETLRNITTAPLDFPAELFEGVSEEAKDFIAQCLNRDPL
jgi:Protein kinase domain